MSAPPQPRPTPKRDSDIMLNKYIYDYMIKRKFKGAALAFLNEANLQSESQLQTHNHQRQPTASPKPNDSGSSPVIKKEQSNGTTINFESNPSRNIKAGTPVNGVSNNRRTTPGPGSDYESSQDVSLLPHIQVPIDAPDGFLFEWWSVFWDIFSARSNQPGSSREALSYIDMVNQMKHSQPNQPNPQTINPNSHLQTATNPSQPSAPTMHGDVPIMKVQTPSPAGNNTLANSQEAMSAHNEKQRQMLAKQAIMNNQQQRAGAKGPTNQMSPQPGFREGPQVQSLNPGPHLHQQGAKRPSAEPQNDPSGSPNMGPPNSSPQKRLKTSPEVANAGAENQSPKNPPQSSPLSGMQQLNGMSPQQIAALQNASQNSQARFALAQYQQKLASQQAAMAAAHLNTNGPTNPSNAVNRPSQSVSPGPMSQQSPNQANASLPPNSGNANMMTSPMNGMNNPGAGIGNEYQYQQYILESQKQFAMLQQQQRNAQQQLLMQQKQLQQPGGNNNLLNQQRVAAANLQRQQILQNQQRGMIPHQSGMNPSGPMAGGMHQLSPQSANANLPNMEDPNISRAGPGVMATPMANGMAPGPNPMNAGRPVMAGRNMMNGGMVGMNMNPNAMSPNAALLYQQNLMRMKNAQMLQQQQLQQQQQH
ncbi:hypothetical protein K7432_011336, partial [Basidiobolus ranarum]